MSASADVTATSSPLAAPTISSAPPLSPPELARRVAIWIIAALLLIPFVWMFATSLKTPAEIFAVPATFWPPHPQWSNYTAAFASMPVLLFVRNTILITALCTLGYLISGSLVAYSFARLRWPGRDALFLVLLATMMLPPQVTIVPLFVIFRQLGWIDTYMPLVVPSWLSGWPFFIFLLRQFFLTIPSELDESARVDGGGYFTIYRRIILPLSKPALASVAIFAFMLHWNDFFGPLIFLSSREHSTLALGLMTYASQHPGEWGILMAMSVLMLLPTLAVFFFCQRYFVEGIALTGSKG